MDLLQLASRRVAEPSKVRRSGGANVKGLAKNTAVTKLTRNRPILALLTSLGC